MGMINRRFEMALTPVEKVKLNEKQYGIMQEGRLISTVSERYTIVQNQELVITKNRPKPVFCFLKKFALL